VLYVMSAGIEPHLPSYLDVACSLVRKCRHLKTRVDSNLRLIYYSYTGGAQDTGAPAAGR
jgi:hypothetical protein